MNIHLSKEVDSELKSASKALGFKEDVMVERAVSFYLDSIRRQLALKRELNQWDALSDEALLSFEKSLQ